MPRLLADSNRDNHSRNSSSSSAAKNISLTPLHANLNAYGFFTSFTTEISALKRIYSCVFVSAGDLRGRIERNYEICMHVLYLCTYMYTTCIHTCTVKVHVHVQHICNNRANNKFSNLIIHRWSYDQSHNELYMWHKLKMVRHSFKWLENVHWPE